MDILKKIYEKYSVIDILIIVAIILLFSFAYVKHLNFVLPDRGREFLLPQEILEGKVPYKDITLIYFPFAYYINALVYKLLGVKIDSLIISQAFFCSLYVIFYYFLSREFLDRFYSFLLSIFIISCCIFATSDIFSYMIPYSYATVYGLLGYLICIFGLVKLHKTNNIKYSYLASLSAGFSVCCKLEFLSVILILILGILLYKKFNISQYLKMLAAFLVFPVINIIILFIQGVSVSNIIDAIKFGVKFSKTGPMTEHLMRSGMYPKALLHNLNDIFKVFQSFITILFFSFVMAKLYKNYKNLFHIFLICIILWNFYYAPFSAEAYWLLLPLAVLFAFIFLFKNIKSDIPILLLLVCALLVAQREFFSLSLMGYGAYALPLLILSTCVLIDRYASKEILSVSLKGVVCCFMIVLIGFYSYGIYSSRKETNFLVRSPKGTIYTKFEANYLLYNTIKYIEDNIDKKATVLVLPEGNIINFLTDRKVDMHCFMMDRLYHDAYGEEKAKSEIEKTKSDYIVLYEGNDVNNFYEPYLYSEYGSLAARYIFSNYKEVANYDNFSGKVKILKRK